MSGVSIRESFFYVDPLLRVIKSKNKNYFRTTSVQGRHSDAFVFVLSGECDYFFDGGVSLTVKSGDILYLAGNANYKMRVHENDYCYIYCDFKFDSEQARRCENFTTDAPEYARRLFESLLSAQRSGSAHSRAEMLSLLYKIYETAVRSGDLEARGKGRSERAKEYIDLHFDDPQLSVASLAKSLDISEVYFRRLFYEAYGCSPSQYVTRVRLDRAMELMKYTFISLEEIAAQSGFSSCQYFSRVFKNHTGVTPAVYRKRK